MRKDWGTTNVGSLGTFELLITQPVSALLCQVGAASLVSVHSVRIRSNPLLGITQHFFFFYMSVVISIILCLNCSSLHSLDCEFIISKGWAPGLYSCERIKFGCVTDRSLTWKNHLVPQTPNWLPKEVEDQIPEFRALCS